MTETAAVSVCVIALAWRRDRHLPDTDSTLDAARWRQLSRSSSYLAEAISSLECDLRVFGVRVPMLPETAIVEHSSRHTHVYRRDSPSPPPRSPVHTHQIARSSMHRLAPTLHSTSPTESSTHTHHRPHDSHARRLHRACALAATQAFPYAPPTCTMPAHKTTVRSYSATGCHGNATATAGTNAASTA